MGSEDAGKICLTIKKNEKPWFLPTRALHFRLKLHLQKTYGIPELPIVKRPDPLRVHGPGGGEGIYTPRLGPGDYLSSEGLSPCIGLAVVTPEKAILVYHFNTSDHPLKTLKRDTDLIPENSHVLLFGGDNEPSSNGTLDSVYEYLNSRNGGLIIDGYVNSPGILVDKDGRYYLTKAMIETREKGGYNSPAEIPPPPITPPWAGPFEGLTVGGP